MDRLEHLGIIQKGLTGYSRVCSDFRILNEKLLRINHAFPLVQDCICRATTVLGRPERH